MEKFAEPGEFVLFIGNYELATDEGTYEIMENYMCINKWYKVKDICEYDGTGAMHYLLEGGAYIPCGSFIVDKKRCIKEQYNLK